MIQKLKVVISTAKRKKNNMTMRATATTTVSFGLVAVPTKIYTTSSPNKVSFKMLSDKGNRLKQKYIDGVTGKNFDKADATKGYEYATGKYVTFTPDEIEKLSGATGNSDSMEIIQFVPASGISRLHIEKSYYLGPDKGGEKAFALLSQAMEKEGVVGIAKWTTRGKEHLVSIRPCRTGGIRGLVMEQVFYAEEMKDFTEIGVSSDCTPAEIEMAGQLIATKTEKNFDFSVYKDQYAENVMNAVDDKVAGRQVVLPPTLDQVPVMDLFDALKASVDAAATG